MAKRKHSATHIEAGPAKKSFGRPATRSGKVAARLSALPPKLRSRPSSSRSAPKLELDTTADGTTTNSANQPRHIMTRARARIFRFTDLPPEIRNLVYDFTFTESEPVPLSQLRLPISLRTSRSFYSEARQYFFLNTPVIVHVRCNWCMRYHHLHLENHTRFDETGLVRDVPAMLQRDSTLTRSVARFQTVNLLIECCCCEQAKQVGSTFIHVRNKQPEMDPPSISNLGHPCRRVAAGLERMFDNARDVLACIGRLPTFNGLSMSDLDWLAGCFQEIPDNSSSSDDSHD